MQDNIYLSQDIILNLKATFDSELIFSGKCVFWKNRDLKILHLPYSAILLNNNNKKIKHEVGLKDEHIIAERQPHQRYNKKQ